ncbi:PEGA domain-containing protein, partial [Candidatus Marinimicrobia bacterium]|nr:PEGA domain-containing protein [Candidatus Neomarinimicrobiota bacterium]
MIIKIGDYLLKVEYDNYEEYFETVSVEYNYDKSIRVDLDPLPAKARFFSTPADAMVYLDGRYIGNTTSSGLSYKVSPGEHTVTMKMDKYYESDDSFNAKAGGNNTVDLTLRKMPKGVSGDANIGFLSVDVWPKDSNINIKNNSYKSSLSYEELLKGKYQVKVSHKGFISESKNIEILAKKHKKLDIKLKQINHSSTLKRSYMFPGLGHFNSQENVKGAMFMGSTIAGFLLMTQSYTEFQDNDKISDAAYQNYVNATSNIEELAAIYKSAHDKAQSSMSKVLGS